MVNRPIELGELQVMGGGLLDLGSGSNVVRFRESRASLWSVGSWLVISNWSGRVEGGGPDQIFVGTNVDGLADAQLREIVFKNPSGFQPGVYGARILSNGEVVPIPSIQAQRFPGHLVLSWPGGFDLLSATNVNGPYSPVDGASTPYTNSLIESERYFKLRLEEP